MAAMHTTTVSILCSSLPRVFSTSASKFTMLSSRQLSLQLLPSFVVPSAIHLNVPGMLEGIWESVLRAVPKKKTSHSKTRSRMMAGKALKDVTGLNKCSACGHLKRAHLLCPYCVSEIKGMFHESNTQSKTNKKVQAGETGVEANYIGLREAGVGTLGYAHISDIFSLAVTPTQILSASGASSIKVHSTTSSDTPLVQTLNGAHKLGCHHIVTSRNGKVAASAGFGGEVKIWSISEAGEWAEQGKIVDGNKAGEIWAVALSEDGGFLASTTYDGRINVWDLTAGRQKIREYETKGSFGMCIDMSRDGRYTASGHENGGVYVFNNETGRMLYSLPGLVKPVRTVSFSPASTRLAAAGDARVIALFDVQHGEQVANLTGHQAWIFSVDWSDTGEYLLSGSFDGKVKVWSIDQRTCVATHSETDKCLWSVKWLPKTGRSEAFATAGANRSISLYREATGG
ncbi:hypothetical protein QTJ16_005705 [Diplocarpon rosae]|uniref:Uncharacterized protein n=1 Tax=Diplocarpon rosae TaxID=946125 RepID=A0AAD9WDD4_9HELO|nr:hypothetical protein QTJ16_005705 [Diplocarpon rosae]